ncbi:MAG: nucleotide exchange factor GrpE [Anaerolineae bacterium]
MNYRTKGTNIPVRKVGDKSQGSDEARNPEGVGGLEGVGRSQDDRRMANSRGAREGVRQTREASTDPTDDQTRRGDVDVVKGRRRKRSPEIPDLDVSGDQAVDWRDAAMRLKAEMDNYRRRQHRWAEASVEREKAELLRKFLEVIDNLEQALKHLDPQDPAHQGVQLAYDGILTLLIREGVERVFAQGRPFDPEIHEAVAVVSAPPDQRVDVRVVEEVSSGYRFKDRVLRPAKVVVAKRGG